MTQRKSLQEQKRAEANGGGGRQNLEFYGREPCAQQLAFLT